MSMETLAKLLASDEHYKRAFIIIRAMPLRAVSKILNLKASEELIAKVLREDSNLTQFTEPLIVRILKSVPKGVTNPISAVIIALLSVQESRKHALRMIRNVLAHHNVASLDLNAILVELSCKDSIYKVGPSVLITSIRYVVQATCGEAPYA